MNERQGAGLATILLGLSSLADAAGTMAGIEVVAMAGPFLYVILAPVWAPWLGTRLVRKLAQVQTA